MATGTANEPLSPSPRYHRRRSCFSFRCFSWICGRSGFDGYEDYDVYGRFRGRIDGRALTGPELDHAGLDYIRPPWWKRAFRRLRARTSRIDIDCCKPPATPDFHYDALSYAMNFDDDARYLQAQQPEFAYSGPITATVSAKGHSAMIKSNAPTAASSIVGVTR